MVSSYPEIGTNPFQRDEILNAIVEFEKLYESRPVKDNDGGMKAPHLFATWFMARALKPKVIIESGIWKGQSTWLLESACPDAQLHSIDLNLGKREFISESASYYEDDFSEIDWSAIDPEETLVFFDDHQNAYSRLQQCHWFGFKQVIFEDNYAAGTGDFYSLKMVFEECGFGKQDEKSAAEKYTSFSAKLTRKLKSILSNLTGGNRSVISQFSSNVIRENSAHQHFLKQNVETYAEFPPVFERNGFPSPPALLSDSKGDQYPLFKKEAGYYNGICFVQLK